MADPASAVRSRAFAATDRNDAWWIGPALTAAGLGFFVVYAFLRVFVNDYYVTGALLAPFYSPLFVVPESWPAWFSPAIFVMWAPAGFRFTCYYYRKAYYRSFAMHPPACAVSESCDRGYRGETAFPWILQNVHRYFMYVALVFPIFLFHDAWKALWPDGPDGPLGATVGTVVLGVNAALLTVFTLSCHALRHLVGGKLDVFSASGGARLRHRAWQGVTRLNEHHMEWAWISLFGVLFADIYVWLVAAGVWNDARIF